MKNLAEAAEPWEARGGGSQVVSEEAATPDAVTSQETIEAPVKATTELIEEAVANVTESTAKSESNKHTDCKETRPQEGKSQRLRGQ